MRALRLVLLQTKSYAKIMAVMMPREKWTDQGLDNLNQKVDDGFPRVDARFDRLEGRLEKRFETIDSRFEQIDSRFAQIDARFERMTDRFEALNRTLIGTGGMIAAALLGILATQL
jgi:hypothetical protein